MASVRTHSRRTRSGGSTTVHRHDRSNRGKSWSQMQKPYRRRKRGLQLRRGFRNLGKAWGYGKRHKRVRACAFGAAGTFELGAWCTSRGLMVIGGAAFLLCAALVVPIAWSVRQDMKEGT